MFDLIKTQWIGITALVVVAVVVFNAGGTAEPMVNVGSGALTTVSNPHTFSNTMTLSGAVTATGVFTASGGVLHDYGSITATTTLTSASDNVQLLPASANMTTITLPSATDGLHFKFVVTGALTGSAVIIDSAEGDNISGGLRVNSAAVACAVEDQINIITDGESLGDWVEIVSDGTSWYIVGSDVVTAAKMTCTDPS